MKFLLEGSQIWSSPRDSPNKNRLGLHRRSVRYLLTILHSKCAGCYPAKTIHFWLLASGELIILTLVVFVFCDLSSSVIHNQSYVYLPAWNWLHDQRFAKILLQLSETCNKQELMKEPISISITFWPCGLTSCGRKMGMVCCLFTFFVAACRLSQEPSHTHINTYFHLFSLGLQLCKCFV